LDKIELRFLSLVSSKEHFEVAAAAVVGAAAPLLIERKFSRRTFSINADLYF